MLSKNLSFQTVLLLIVIGSFGGCISNGSQQSPAISTEIPSKTISVTASMAAITSIPDVKSENAAFIAPLAANTMIRLESWSPDGKFFAYWSFDAEQRFDYSYPPGTLYFLRTDREEICSYSYPVMYSGQDSLNWQADGTVIILAGNLPRSGVPCENFSVVTDATNIPANVSNFSLSPGGNYRAVTKVLDTAPYLAETTILNMLTGSVENNVQWKFHDVMKSPGEGQWLNSNQFLINETADQGPLLITVGQGVVRVADDIFGQPVNCREDCFLTANGASVLETDSYHIVLFGVGETSSFPAIQMYHSESSVIEKIPFQQGGFFSPDGKWLIFYDERISTQKSRGNFQLWLRPVDPAGATVNFLASTDVNPFPLSWSPDNTKLAIPSSTGVTVFRFYNDTLVETERWKTDDYRVIEALWSPDSQSLVLRGDLSAPGSQEALFLIRLR